MELFHFKGSLVCRSILAIAVCQRSGWHGARREQRLSPADLGQALATALLAEGLAQGCMGLQGGTTTPCPSVLQLPGPLCLARGQSAGWRRNALPATFSPAGHSRAWQGVAALPEEAAPRLQVCLRQLLGPYWQCMYLPGAWYYIVGIWNLPSFVARSCGIM